MDEKPTKISPSKRSLSPAVDAAVKRIKVEPGTAGKDNIKKSDKVKAVVSKSRPSRIDEYVRVRRYGPTL